ncbi:F-box only protein 34 isoform X1 [Pelobates fuscus]|uniref:F-box only protein 34 isoform X1 n=2 Tax=Pelobates fuscus TaxID=191477 RepID=UPI002FE47274
MQLLYSEHGGRREAGVSCNCMLTPISLSQDQNSTQATLLDTKKNCWAVPCAELESTWTGCDDTPWKQAVRMSSCRVGLHREPLKSSSFAYQHVKRLLGMHLKPYHKLQKKESFLETRSNRGMHLNNQNSVKEETCKGATKNCLPSNDNPSRLPLGAISQNTIQCNTVGLTPNSFEVQTKNVQSQTIHHGDTGEGPLDICAIIKPGNTKEKVAFFAAHHYSNIRNSSMKMKCTADMNGRAAKRRKKSVDLKRVKNQLEKMQESQKCFLSDAHPNGVENCSMNYVASSDGILPDKPLSVIEMVAFLERRASALLSDCAKPFNNNNHTSRLPGTSKCSLPVSVSLMSPDKDNVEKDDQPESVCVLEMVAKLESECLRHQNVRESGGLSRSNSFRRNVGRMLLASGSQLDSNSSQKVSSISAETVENVEASANVPHNKTSFLVKSWANCPQAKAQETQSLSTVEDLYVANVDFDLVRETCLQFRSRGDISITVEPCTYSLHIKAVECVAESTNVNDCAVDDDESFDGFPAAAVNSGDILMHTLPECEIRCTQDKALTLSCDSCPGTLFFQHDQNHAHVKVNSELKTQMEVQKKTAFSNALCIQNSSLIAQYAVSISSLGSVSQVLDTSIKRQVSHNFLETRFKIQQLLEPQQYMIFLPHHIIVKIFHYLPTRTLAALKCTSCYFKFIIEHYDIRPCDSLWVRDPRYKDDPCKQCKKKYAKGDVSLCWWHPKPYCQALPYGPGFWMCCHVSPKDSRGCKVGLHDNRWVPACHSFNRTICKKSESEED